MKQLAPVCALLVVLFVFPPTVGERQGSSEAEAVATVRAVVTAQEVHARRHDGRFTTPACLAAIGCAGAGAPVLDPSIATLPDRAGYRFTFHPGPASDAGDRALAGYAITAQPIDGPNLRGLCADATGAFVWSGGPGPPAVGDGRCDVTGATRL